MVGKIRAQVYRGLLLGMRPAKVLGKVRYGPNTLPVLVKVRYGFNTEPNTPVRFGTNSTPVTDTSLISVLSQMKKNIYFNIVGSEAIGCQRTTQE